MTTLTLKHIDETPDSTVSELMRGDEHLCYIVEDGYREVKVRGQTRIPAGRYELFARESGGFWGRYKARFGHDFVIGFKNVPGFKWILIHIGNSVGNTEGCLLSNTEYFKGEDGNYRGAGSTEAYLKVHGLFSDWIKEGPVFLDIDRGAVTEEPEAEEPVTEPEAEPPAPEPEDPPQPSGCFGHMAVPLTAFFIFLIIMLCLT